MLETFQDYNSPSYRSKINKKNCIEVNFVSFYQHSVLTDWPKVLFSESTSIYHCLEDDGFFIYFYRVLGAV